MSQGKSQTVLLTLRDAIATAGTLATGALALADFQNPATQSTVLAVVGLGTAGATAGIDIYTQRFLFGVENIDSVRELTINAITAHQRDIHGRSSTFVYDDVVKALLDDQAICTPRHIALLVRHAIAAGTVEAVAPSTAEADLVAQADAAIIARLTKNLGLAPPLSDVQLLAIWWLAKEAIGDEGKAQRALVPLLSDKEPTTATIELLGALSAGKQAALRQKVADARLKQDADANLSLTKKLTPSEEKKSSAKTLELKKQSEKAEAEVVRTKPAAEGQVPPTISEAGIPQPNYNLRSTIDIVKATPLAPK